MGLVEDDLSVAGSRRADSARLNELLRELVASLATLPVPEVAPDGTAVLLDAEVLGVRCLLIRTPPDQRSTGLTLSPREREIARMVALGYPNKTIASVLEISGWTVGTHLRRIFAKLGVSSRAAMVAHLSSNGFLRDRR
jgi:DNA-binding CsgD family transcriptional regulator